MSEEEKLPPLKYIYVCRNCAFTTMETGKAVEHSGPGHVVVRFERSTKAL